MCMHTVNSSEFCNLDFVVTFYMMQLISPPYANTRIKSLQLMLSLVRLYPSVPLTVDLIKSSVKDLFIIVLINVVTRDREPNYPLLKEDHNVKILVRMNVIVLSQMITRCGNTRMINIAALQVV